MSSSLRILTVLGLLVAFAAGIAIERYVLSADVPAVADHDSEHARKHLEPTYVCPMHVEIVRGEPGSCPICGMDLVKREAPQEKAVEDDGRPVVSISPEVINNLGVKTIPVRRDTLVRTIETPGFIQQIIKDKYTPYRTPARGRVNRVLAGPEQWLETGDPLMELELDDLVMVQERHLELLARSQRDSSSAETVSDPGSESVDSSETDAEQDQAEAGGEQTAEYTRALMQRAGMSDEQIQALEQSGETSPLIILYAGHPGQILERRVADGDRVEANAFLFSLGGMMRVTVIANAFQRDASWIRPGMPVDIILPHDSQKKWPGVVSQGVVSIDTTSQNINVKLLFIAPNDLVKGGMYIVGQIYGQVREDTLVLPREAVIYHQNEKRVIVALGDGRYKPVPVEIGITTNTDVEILGGLEEGDEVVVSAQFLIDSESSLQASFRRLNSE